MEFTAIGATDHKDQLISFHFSNAQRLSVRMYVDQRNLDLIHTEISLALYSLIFFSKRLPLSASVH